MVGAQTGEKRQVLVDFPADFPQKPLAGKKATYFVDVVALKEKKLPELGKGIGEGIRGFKSAMKADEDKASDTKTLTAGDQS